MNTDEGLRIYGAGIVSSKGESIYSLDSPSPNRIGFDIERVMSTRYRIDTYQQTYFVIENFEQLFEATRPDFTPIYAKLHESPAHAAGDVLDGDRVFTRGDRVGWATGADT
jgi:phenylalanine-4-hydroxylase